MSSLPRRVSLSPLLVSAPVTRAAAAARASTRGSRSRRSRRRGPARVSGARRRRRDSVVVSDVLADADALLAFVVLLDYFRKLCGLLFARAADRFFLRFLAFFALFYPTPLLMYPMWLWLLGKPLLLDDPWK